MTDLTDVTDLARRARRRLRERGALRERVRVLEEEVQENRRLNRRIAELTDVVVELLVPLEARDQERVEEVLGRFRSGV
ncbi:hypothetical protein GCM10022237_12410 [Nocardioides ginsengisoli]|uniref:DUF6752 domain-containing protein n=1 Tax=Nocardioides ginsengisoli TaxID=363868 RepID=A0ABW3W931_9ACTN